MATRIYVGNIASVTTENDIRVLFESVGTVTSCELAVDPFRGQSRGFAFVEMETHDEFEKAIEECNGKELDGNTLVVNEARPPAERSFSSGGRSGGRSGGSKQGKFKSGKGSRRGIRRAKRARKGAR